MSKAAAHVQHPPADEADAVRRSKVKPSRKPPRAPGKDAARPSDAAGRHSDRLSGGANDSVLILSALTNGAQRAFEGELAGLARLSVEQRDEWVTALREQLGNLTGGSEGGSGGFDEAYLRLLAAALADGEEDEALMSGELKTLLGERYLDALPLVLKLIYLEIHSWDQTVEKLPGVQS